jgi:hypothetical protein
MNADKRRLGVFNGAGNRRERALRRELALRGIPAIAQAPVTVLHKGQSAQCLNYPRASGKTVCLLVNFQKPRVEWKRIVLGYTEPQS